jgi:hypothetical protein
MANSGEILMPSFYKDFQYWVDIPYTPWEEIEEYGKSVGISIYDGFYNHWASLDKKHNRSFLGCKTEEIALLFFSKYGDI